MAKGYKRLESYLNVLHINSLADSLELQNDAQHGRGILAGCVISEGAAAFEIEISAGIVLGQKAVAVPAMDSIFCAPSTTTYIWISEPDLMTSTVTVTQSEDPDDIGGDNAPIGVVVTDGSGVTSITNENRVDLPRFTDIWTHVVGDNLVVTDILNSKVGIGKVPDSDFDVDGVVAADSLLVTNSPLGPAAVAAANIYAAANFGGF